jgi:hypothetical protein
MRNPSTVMVVDASAARKALFCENFTYKNLVFYENFSIKKLIFLMYGVYSGS